MDQSINDVLAQLKLRDIASWQEPEMVNEQPKIIATLPALQRGFVWKPRQIENLWDSLMRGFPIGSFLVAPYQEEKLGSQDMKYAQKNEGRQYTHYLLDGQQRATAIALGFINPIYRIDSAAFLWIDIDPTTGQTDDREFIFRVITQFHPWGFTRTNAENRLKVSEIRDAFEAYKNAAKQTEDDEALQQVSALQFPLTHAWPWDAKAPVPVAFLWKVKTRDEILPKLEQLKYWNGQHPPKWKDRVKAAILGQDMVLAKRLDDILKRFTKLEDYEVPVLTVKMDPEVPKDDREASERPDHIETLFVRVNSGGTQLEGEELIYSIFKSECPKVPQFIEKLDHRLTSPARTVVLAARLIQARRQPQDKRDRQPPVPDVTMFRRWLRGPDKFKNELENAIQDHQGNVSRVFEAAYHFLTLDNHAKSTGQRNYRLHPYLVADLARGAAGHEVLILLLRWVDRLLEAGIDPVDLDENTKRRSLGFITAMAWFGLDARECVHRLWPDLQTCGVVELKAFFNATSFKNLISREEGEGVILIPPMSSDVFSHSLDNLRNSIGEQLDNPESSYWAGWDFYQNYKRSTLKNWMVKTIHPLWHESQRQEDVAWWIDRIWEDRKFVIYAQRDWLIRWFPGYDPTIPGAADTNRPWDYDHIHPNNYIAGKWYLSNFLKTLHWSNGNFRAWPLEANRSDQDIAPHKKLKNLSLQEKTYKLDVEDLPAASFIKDQDELEHWCKSIPDEVIGTNTPYLSNYPEYRVKYRDSHLALINAITNRLGRIYAEWFDSLALADLLPKNGEQ